MALSGERGLPAARFPGMPDAKSSQANIPQANINDRRSIERVYPQDAFARDAAANDRERRSDGRFQGIPRARVLAVATTVTPPITPIRVVEAFAERGETVNLEQIRIALNRIAKDGDLIKTGASVFALPGAVPEPRPRPAEAPQESPADATEAFSSPFRLGVLGTGVTSTWRETT